MNIREIIKRRLPPSPWEEGDNIPWSDPGFSKRMLKEHLSQHHDAASRRFSTVHRQVQWIHRHVLLEKPSRILDLGCGPGLYTQRLTELGHQCIGIDYSPASIAYARDRARDAKLAIEYRQEDIRTAHLGKGFDLVMVIFGEFNVFSSPEVRKLLQEVRDSLDTGGCLLVECSTFDAIQDRGQQPAWWQSVESGLFSDKPHLWLQEHFWDAHGCTATTRYFIVGTATGCVTCHASTSQAYTDDDYQRLFRECGFSHIEKFPSLTGTEDGCQEGLFVIVADKKGAPQDAGADS